MTDERKNKKKKKQERKKGKNKISIKFVIFISSKIYIPSYVKNDSGYAVWNDP